MRSAWRDTVVRVRHISVPGQSEWTQARIAAAALRDSGRFAEAVQLLEPYTARNPDYQELALLYYGLAGIARAWGDDDQRLNYLAE